MKRYVANPDTLLFEHGKDSILSNGRVALRFSDANLVALLGDILRLLRLPRSLAELESCLSERYRLDHIRATWEMLGQQQLLVENSAETPGARKVRVFCGEDSLARLEAFASLVLPELCVSGSILDMSAGPEAVKFLQWAPEELPAISVPHYDHAFLCALNRHFLGLRQRWALQFRHRQKDFFLSFLPGETSCFECLWPLQVADMPLTGVSVAMGRGDSRLDDLLGFGILMTNLRNSFSHGESGNTHVLTFDRARLSQSATLRIIQPRCPACGKDAR